MKKQLLLFVLFLCAIPAARAQLTSTQKLYYLCKTWGYLKYHHPNTCNVRWNDLLLEKLDSVNASTTDAEYHAIVYNMCRQTGITTRPGATTSIAGDTAINYSTSWFNDPQLSPQVRDFLDSVQAHRVPGRCSCFLSNNNYSDPNYISWIDFRADSIRNVPNFSYANFRHRMLVYFYYWNAIRYFAPQIRIADHSWEQTLTDFMPAIGSATNDSSFLMTLGRAAGRTDDAHGSFNSPYTFAFATGSGQPVTAIAYAKLVLARIDNQNVVTASGHVDIDLGDVITKIDGQVADSYFTERMPYFSGGNIGTKWRDVLNVFTRAQPNTTHQLELHGANGVNRTVTMRIDENSTDYNNWFNNKVDTLPEWTIGRCGYGYVNMSKLLKADVQAMYSDLQHTPAIIFDIRNYPQFIIGDLKKLMIAGPNRSANYFYPDLGTPGYYSTDNDQYNFGSWSNGTPYAGKVIVLVNEETQSRAEYTAQALRTFPNAVVYGSQTAGADGNICYLDLPRCRVYWTGLGWYESDWRNPQRAGVKVDSFVRPTLAGIRAGMDEVLERASNCTLGIPNPKPQNSFSVAQDGRNLTVRYTGSDAYSLQLVDMLGHTVIRRSQAEGNTTLDGSALSSGIYLLLAQDANRSGQKIKVVIP